MGAIVAGAAIGASGGLTLWLADSLGMALAVASLVSCALVAIALLVATPDEVVVSLPEADERRRAKALRAQLLFADCEPGRVVIDALVLDGATAMVGGLPVSPATPLALEMRMPSAEWFSASIGDLLDEWADDSEMVDLELLQGALGPRVRLSRDEARITLDLTRVDGVPAPLALGSA